jgi:uncharacterized NAD(P)/FAD-binding protein YdhS
VTSVAIVGGGAAGALQALHLKKAGFTDITLIERSRPPGRGVAFSTTRPEHLLNVPARRMSAHADDLDHFTRWYAARTGGTDEDFAPRMLFGDYISGVLAEAGLSAIEGEVVDLADGTAILADGRRIKADAFVLAPGNLRPATPAGIDPEALGDLWVADPWAEDIAEGLEPGDVVMLLGTGLTAVDVALTLEALAFPGRIVALSRRGLAPRSHGPREPLGEPPQNLVPTCVAMLRRVRERSREVGWRTAVHELRPVTEHVWQSASETEKRRFLRHLRAWWDVHRHKVAPAVGEALDTMQGAARLSVAAGRIVSIEPEGDRALVRFRARGKDEVETLRVARIVNCTGPELDIVRSGETLLANLLAAGRIRPDPLKVGVEVDEDCRAVGANGSSADDLYVIGTLTRGTFWESVAVPDIRAQTVKIAERIAAKSAR